MTQLHCKLAQRHDFDAIIDVRSPAEFAEDHIPGAINAPVLNNEERARIGTIYKQESVFKANRLGAALVARNIASHLEGIFADRPKSWKPLIYCWRGGKRSASTTQWFNLLGWRARQLSGGYKSWRTHVLTQLDQIPQNYRFIVLTGPTGSGKTRLLHALAASGAQTLDLEGLACHRGSVLGSLPDHEQPTQKGFDTRLLTALEQLAPALPVFVEAESRAIGRLSLPAALLPVMHAGACIDVRAPLDKRIDFLLEDYRHLFATPTQFHQTLERLVKLHSRATVTHWQQLIAEERRAELFRELVETHYDPAYRRSSTKHFVGLDNALAFDYDPTIGGHDQALKLLQKLNIKH